MPQHDQLRSLGRETGQLGPQLPFNDPLTNIINIQESAGRDPLANATPHVPGQFFAEQLVNQGLKAVTLPRDVYQGQVDPTSGEGLRRTADLAGALAGGGLTAALGRPGASVGMFGGKLAGKPGGPQTAPKRRIEYQDQFETIEVVDLPGARKLQISIEEGFNTNTRRTKDGSFEVTFQVDQLLPPSSKFKNVKIRSPEHRAKLGIAPPSAEEMRIIRRALVDSVTEFVSKKKPQRIMFSPADSRLQAFYDKAAPLLAKKLGGKHRKQEGEHIISFFDKHGKPVAGATVGLTLGIAAASEDEMIKRGDLI